MKLGFLDSGIGGLCILECLHERFPSIACFYLGDQKNFPYGEKSKEELLRLTQGNLLFLQKQGVTHAILACNTLCATVFEEMSLCFPEISFINVLELTAHAALKAISSHEVTDVFLLATTATLSSGAYQKRLAGSNVLVHEWPCASLIEALEKGDVRTQEEALHALLADVEVRRKGRLSYKPMILLGCTHLEMAKPALENAHPITLFSSQAVVKHMSDAWMLHHKKEQHFIKPMFFLQNHLPHKKKTLAAYMAASPKEGKAFYKTHVPFYEEGEC